MKLWFVFLSGFVGLVLFMVLAPLTDRPMPVLFAFLFVALVYFVARDERKAIKKKKEIEAEVRASASKAGKPKFLGGYHG